MIKKTFHLISAMVILFQAGIVSAGVILGATSATINDGGPGGGDIANTFNQAGLNTTYTAGITDFDTYIAGNPTHDWEFDGNEWYSNIDRTDASVTYNLGSLQVIDAIAIWNEDGVGVGLLDLFSSTDNSTFSSFASGLVPTNNPPSIDYGADVFSFAAISAQYIRFDVSQCPPFVGPDFTLQACAIAEVAFRAADASVPAPATLALFGLGLVGLGWSRRKRA